MNNFLFNFDHNIDYESSISSINEEEEEKENLSFIKIFESQIFNQIKDFRESLNEIEQRLIREKKEIKEKRKKENEKNRIEKLKKIQEKRKAKLKEKEILKPKDEYFLSKNTEINILKENTRRNIYHYLLKEEKYNKMLNLLEYLYKTQECEYSEIQKKILINCNNILILGRSGTGKTLISFTKMFLIKMMTEFFEYKSIIKAIDPEFYPRIIYTTVSNALILDVKKNYEIMQNKFKTKCVKEKKKEKIMYSEENIIMRKDEMLETIYFNEPNNQNDFGKAINLNFNTYYELKEDNYPLFTSMHSYLNLIDSTLIDPFFLRKENGEIILSHLNLKINQNQNISYPIKNFISKINKESFCNTLPEKNEITYAKMIDYEVFRTEFWDLNKKKKITESLDPLSTWTEISTYIKGYSNSFEYENRILPKDQYLQIIGGHKSILTKEIKEKIWDIVKFYEKWKTDINGFDIMDFVSYLLSQFLEGNHRCIGRPDFIFLDEIQDIQPSIIFLMSLISKENVMYCGDTAQTIASGVEFRFADMNFIHYNANNNKFDYKLFPVLKNKPEFNILNINYRSQGAIIEFANFIIRILEILFPTCLDKVEKEIPLDKALPPIFLSSKDQLKIILDKLNQNTKNKCTATTIIVRNKAKQQELINYFKESAVICTIFESKGLEFDNVVLYDFFHDSTITKKKWEFLHDQWENKNNNNNNKYVINNDKEIILELKHLYVAITRARSNIIVFDQTINNRKYFERMISGFVKIIQNDYYSNYLCESLDFFMDYNENKKKNPFGCADLDYLKLELENAVKYYNRKLYHQAFVLFNRLNIKKYAEISYAYYLVKKSQDLDLELDNETICNDCDKAATIFVFYNLKKEAAKAYFSCKNYIKAKTYFLETESWNEAGETVLFIIKESINLNIIDSEYQLLYKEAASYFKKSNNVQKELYCFQTIEDFENCLEIIIDERSNFNRIMDRISYLKLIKKYFKLYIKKTYSFLKLDNITEKEIIFFLKIYDQILNAEFFSFENYVKTNGKIMEELNFISSNFNFSQDFIFKFLCMLLRYRYVTIAENIFNNLNYKNILELFFVLRFFENNYDFEQMKLKNYKDEDLLLKLNLSSYNQLIDIKNVIPQIFLINPDLLLLNCRKESEKEILEYFSPLTEKLKKLDENIKIYKNDIISDYVRMNLLDFKKYFKFCESEDNQNSFKLILKLLINFNTNLIDYIFTWLGDSNFQIDLLKLIMKSLGLYYFEDILGHQILSQIISLIIPLKSLKLIKNYEKFIAQYEYHNSIRLPMTAFENYKHEKIVFIHVNYFLIFTFSKLIKNTINIINEYKKIYDIEYNLESNIPNDNMINEIFFLLNNLDNLKKKSIIFNKIYFELTSTMFDNEFLNKNIHFCQKINTIIYSESKLNLLLEKNDTSKKSFNKIFKEKYDLFGLRTLLKTNENLILYLKIQQNINYIIEDLNNYNFETKINKENFKLIMNQIFEILSKLQNYIDNNPNYSLNTYNNNSKYIEDILELKNNKENLLQYQEEFLKNPEKLLINLKNQIRELEINLNNCQIIYNIFISVKKNEIIKNLKISNENALLIFNENKEKFFQNPQIFLSDLILDISNKEKAIKNNQNFLKQFIDEKICLNDNSDIEKKETSQYIFIYKKKIEYYNKNIISNMKELKKIKDLNSNINVFNFEKEIYYQKEDFILSIKILLSFGINELSVNNKINEFFQNPKIFKNKLIKTYDILLNKLQTLIYILKKDSNSINDNTFCIIIKKFILKSILFMLSSKFYDSHDYKYFWNKLKINEYLLNEISNLCQINKNNIIKCMFNDNDYYYPIDINFNIYKLFQTILNFLVKEKDYLIKLDLEFTQNLYYFVYENLKNYFIEGKINIFSESFDFESINENFITLSRIIVTLKKSNNKENSEIKNMCLNKDKIIEKYEKFFKDEKNVQLDSDKKIESNIIIDNENKEIENVKRDEEKIKITIEEKKEEEIEENKVENKEKDQIKKIDENETKKNIEKESISQENQDFLPLKIWFISDEKAFDLKNFEIYNILSFKEINNITEKYNEEKFNLCNDYNYNLMIFESNFILKMNYEKQINYNFFTKDQNCNESLIKEYIKGKRSNFMERSYILNQFYANLNMKKLGLLDILINYQKMKDLFNSEVNFIKKYNES